MKLEPCIPPLWAKTGHAQTIFGHLLPSPRLRRKGRRLEIEVGEGDRIVAFVEEGTSNSVVYVFHGLAGSSDSAYMHRTSMLAQAMGHTVVLVNHRGCGEGAGLAKGPYHSGRAEDLSRVIEAGRELFPKKRHVAIGFSMSANALLLLLSGRRGETLPDAAISVNAPIDLARCADLLSSGFNRIYDTKFYIDCRRDVLIGESELAKNLKLPPILSLYDFDQIYTAPAGGFESREHYYDSCSTHRRLTDIKVPTIIITAKDDPFVAYESFAEAQVSSHVLVHIENFGGHMGYLSRERTPFGTKRWQDYAVDQALRELHS